MARFKQFLEQYDDDAVSPEEVASDAQKVNARLKPPFDEVPDYVDPDDFLNHAGVFTFSYSYRRIKKDSDYEPEGLVIDHAKTMHRHMLQGRDVYYDDLKKPIITGRYGLHHNNTPIVTFWETNKYDMVKDSLKQMWTQKLIHPESYLFINDNKGKVRDFILPNSSGRLQSQVSQEVDIAGQKYSIRELPMYLHTLPDSSPVRQQIAAFICDNKDKYPILANLAAKAKCNQSAIYNKPRPTLQQRMAMSTSESNFS